nr:MauE/DoxX family redox-associated membrane protein [Actinomyces bowdenii]
MLFLGCYFVYAGASKLGSPTPLWVAIMSYRITGLRSSRLLAATIPPIEFFCGLLLASQTFPAGSASILIGLLTIFSAGMVVTILRGEAPSDCGCGPRPSPVSPALVLRNLILIAALAPGVVADHPPPRMDQVIATAVVAIIAVGVSVRRHQALTTQHTTPSQRSGGSFTD